MCEVESRRLWHPPETGALLWPGHSAWPASWSQIVASTSTPFVLCGAYLLWNAFAAGGTSLAIDYAQFQIGIGTLSNEVPIAHAAFGASVQNPSPNTVNIILATLKNILFQPTFIPTGTRIAVRGSHSGAATLHQNSIYLVGYNATTFSLPLLAPESIRYIKGLKGVTLGTNVSPSLATTTVTSAAFTTYGSWTEILASAANDLLIRGVMASRVEVGASCQIKIGIGSTNNEVEMAKVAAAKAAAGKTGSK